MNKFDRIQILKVLGLNTEESILISSVEDWRNSGEFLSKYDSYSVRTFRGPRYGQSAPLFPIIGREELEAGYRSHLEKGLRLIVAAPIDPKDAEMAGCLIYNAGVLFSLPERTFQCRPVAHFTMSRWAYLYNSFALEITPFVNGSRGSDSVA